MKKREKKRESAWKKAARKSGVIHVKSYHVKAHTVKAHNRHIKRK